MTEPLNPASLPTFGAENWILVNTIADMQAPTAVEAVAGTSFDITLVLFADGTARPTVTTERVSALRRFGATKTNERRGSAQFTGGDFAYAMNTQATTGSPSRKLFEAIPEGTTKILMQRIGVPRATTPIATHRVNLYPVQFGLSVPTTIGDGAAAEAGAVAPFFIINDPVFDVALV